MTDTQNDCSNCKYSGRDHPACVMCFEAHECWEPRNNSSEILNIDDARLREIMDLWNKNYWCGGELPVVMAREILKLRAELAKL